MNTLKGKVAFVAGGARGIRAAIALRLAQEGVNVAFTFIRSEERAQNHGGLCAYCADIDWRTSSGGGWGINDHALRAWHHPPCFRGRYGARACAGRMGDSGCCCCGGWPVGGGGAAGTFLVGFRIPDQRADNDGPNAELPRFISTAKARELYGLRKGEPWVRPWLDISESEKSAFFRIKSNMVFFMVSNNSLVIRY